MWHLSVLCSTTRVPSFYEFTHLIIFNVLLEKKMKLGCLRLCDGERDGSWLYLCFISCWFSCRIVDPLFIALGLAYRNLPAGQNLPHGSKITHLLELFALTQASRAIPKAVSALTFCYYIIQTAPVVFVVCICFLYSQYPICRECDTFVISVQYKHRWRGMTTLWCIFYVNFFISSMI